MVKENRKETSILENSRTVNNIVTEYTFILMETSLLENTRVTNIMVKEYTLILRETDM